MYVSITGLKVRGLLRAPLFWWHAVRSFNQARTAPGNISAAVRTDVAPDWDTALAYWHEHAREY